MDIAYEKLLNSLEKGELKEYLKGTGHYRIPSYEERFGPVQNNYYFLNLALNKYGEKNQNFGGIVNKSIIEILQTNNPIDIYSMFQIVREQLSLEYKKEEKFKFIDEILLKNLRAGILANREALENYKTLEAQDANGGMYEVFMGWSQKIEKATGYKIL